MYSMSRFRKVYFSERHYKEDNRCIFLFKKYLLVSCGHKNIGFNKKCVESFDDNVFSERG